MALKATIKYDEEDKHLLYKYNWNTKNGYLYCTPVGYFHQLIMKPPKGMQVDHINRDKLDNRKCNLRLCTHQQNMRNQDKYILKRGATSQYKGVSKKGNRWVAIIYVDQKPIRLGSYECEHQAGLSYNLKAKELFGDIGDRYNSLFNGRPDVLIEVRELSTKKLVKAIIGEVKHTTDRDYAIQGLKELIEYINYIKQKISSRYEYISNIREIDIKGMLFLDNIKVNQLTNKDIKIITIRERETKIELDFQWSFSFISLI